MPEKFGHLFDLRELSGFQWACDTSVRFGIRRHSTTVCVLFRVGLRNFDKSSGRAHSRWLWDFGKKISLLPRRIAVCAGLSTPLTFPKFLSFRGPFLPAPSHLGGVKSHSDIPTASSHIPTASSHIPNPSSDIPTTSSDIPPPYSYIPFLYKNIIINKENS